jgi:hypothetical protein
MKCIICILMISGLVLVSCFPSYTVERFPEAKFTVARYTVVKPIYPEIAADNNFPDPIESLQPTFRWEPVIGTPTYDFIIYKAFIYKGNGMRGWPHMQRAVGQEIYCRQGLKEPEYKIEEPLAPNAEYYWSVRVRRGEFFSDWSLYYEQMYSGGPTGRGNYRPYIFKTPKK